MGSKLLLLKCFESATKWLYLKHVSGSVQVLKTSDKSGWIGLFPFPPTGNRNNQTYPLHLIKNDPDPSNVNGKVPSELISAHCDGDEKKK